MVSVPQFIKDAQTRRGERVERRHKRHERRDVRRVRFGELFTQEELDEGDVVLEEVEPTPEPDEEPSEPWDVEKPTQQIRDRIAAYQATLANWRERHPEEPVGDPDEEAETEESE
jgi:hypothetical protein